MVERHPPSQGGLRAMNSNGMGSGFLRGAVAGLLVLLWPGPGLAATDPVSGYIEALLRDQALLGDAGQAAEAETLLEVYGDRSFAPLWTAPERRAQLAAAAARADLEGLNPDRYDADLLGRWAGESVSDPVAAAQLDFVASRTLLRLATDLRLGRTDPAELQSGWNYRPPESSEAFHRRLPEIFHAPDVERAVYELLPDHPAYRGLRSGLARYRALQAAGGWPSIDAGPTLRPGDRGSRILQLRQRLAVTGELSREKSLDDHFDPGLQQAVRLFQQHHGLNDDGVVGAHTLSALNVTVAHRIEQIRVNLQRARWILHELREPYVGVDIAAFSAYYRTRGEVIWRSRAVVGKPDRPTPVFKSAISHLVINPTWTVPPTILREDLLPTLRRDPGYLMRHDFRVIGAGGNWIDPGSVDWWRVKARSVPYILRQEPGPTNPVGRIKFMFPNPEHVYLHDTPSRSLFRKDMRIFSSGCIRIQRPFELAELLLDDPDRWNRDTFAEVVMVGRTRTVHLPRPVRVFLMYWTAEAADDSGRMLFREDVYQRDPPLLAAIEGTQSYAAAQPPP